MLNTFGQKPSKDRTTLVSMQNPRRFALRPQHATLPSNSGNESCVPRAPGRVRPWTRSEVEVGQETFAFWSLRGPF